MRLKEKGVPYWSRPDLGIDAEDVVVAGSAMKVTVHSVGAVDAPGGKVVVRDAGGKVVATAAVPALKAPTDLVPKTAVVTVRLPPGFDGRSGSVAVECGGSLPEITMMNNRVDLAAPRDGLSAEAIRLLQERR